MGKSLVQIQSNAHHRTTGDETEPVVNNGDEEFAKVIGERRQAFSNRLSRILWLNMVDESSILIPAACLRPITALYCARRLPHGCHRSASRIAVPPSTAPVPVLVPPLRPVDSGLSEAVRALKKEHRLTTGSELIDILERRRRNQDRKSTRLN